MRIGSNLLRNNLILAPLAEVTYRPFHQLYRKLGAGMAVSEMISSNPDSKAFHARINRLEQSEEQLRMVVSYFDVSQQRDLVA